MKKRGVLLGIFAVVLLCICSAMPTWAYTITVQNDTDESLGVRIFFGAWTASYSDDVPPRSTLSYSNTDWKTAGLCWDGITVFSRGDLILHCESKAEYHPLFLECRDVKVILRRSGCDIIFEVTH